MSQRSPFLLERTTDSGAVDQDQGHGIGGMGGERSPVLRDHAIGVAMVGRDQSHSTLFLYRIDDHAHTGIHGLNRCDSRADDTGMTDHVAVGEVDDVQIGLVGKDGIAQLDGNLRLAHLGLQIVGCNLGGRDKRARLALLGRLDTAVHEEGDVRVLLGFGDVVLP